MRILNYTVAAISLLTVFSALAETSSAPPEWEISNASTRVKLYLPDAARGFYRGTRFDWSGVVADLQYAGHSYYGPWFTQTDPKIPDFIYQGSDVVAGPCSAITGPVDEFTPSLGYDEAKAGGTFIKVGVGVLRKPDDGKYSGYKLYEIVDGGKRSVKKGKTAVEFSQEVHDPATGFGYVYSKKISLAGGKPEMLIEHSLRNAGTRPIHTSVYDHNFLVLDKQPIGPAFTITLPFDITATPPFPKESAEVRKNKIAYVKTLEAQDRVYGSLRGFSQSSNDYSVRIENAAAMAGMTISGDRPLARMALWSIRSVLAVEPFIDISIEPGSELTWTYDYEYYTLPRAGGK